MTTRKKPENREPRQPQQALQARQQQQAQQLQQTAGKEDALTESVTSRLEEPLSKERVTVPLVGESLQVDKRWVEAGVLELRKSVTTLPQTMAVELTHEEIDIERVPVNKALEHGQEAGPRQEGDTWIIPIVEEELVVTKRRIVREEVRIRKKQVVTRQQVSDTVRSEELQVKTSGDIQVIGD